MYFVLVSFFSLQIMLCHFQSPGSHLCHCAVVNWYNWGLQPSCQNIIKSCSFASWQESVSCYCSWKHQESLLESCQIWSRTTWKMDMLYTSSEDEIGPFCTKMWHNQEKWATCRQYSILIFQYKSLVQLKCYILIQTPSKLVMWLQRYEKFFVAQNNVKHKSLSPLLACNSKSIFPTSDSFPLIMSQMGMNKKWLHDHHQYDLEPDMIVTNGAILELYQCIKNTADLNWADGVWC